MLGWLVSCVVGSVLALTVTAVPADATTDPELTIVTPVSGRTVAGTVSVSVALRQGSTDAGRVREVYVEVFGGGGSQLHDFPVPQGTCPSQCTFTADFDTLTFVAPTSTEARQPNLGDGLAEFSATMLTGSGRSLSTSIHATIDNHRPSLQLPDLPRPPGGGNPIWEGYESLETRIDSKVNPGSSATRMWTVRLLMPNRPTSALADVTMPAPATGAGPTGVGTVTIDTRHEPANYSAGYLVAFDSDGVASDLQKIYVKLDDGFRPRATSRNADRDTVTVSVAPEWDDPSVVGPERITRMAVSLHGVLLGSTTSFAQPHEFGTVTGTAPAGQQFPAGDNTFDVVVTDDHGVDRATTADVTTTDPLTVDWKVGSLDSSGPLPVHVTVDDASQLPMFYLSMTADGANIGGDPVITGSHAVMDAASYARLLPGKHRLTLTVTLFGGQVFTRYQDVDVFGTPTVSLQAPASATWGRSAPLRASFTNGGAQANVPVQLQASTSPASGWTVRATTRTASNGVANFAGTALGARTYYRVVAPAYDHGLAAGSPVRAVTTTSAFGRMPAKTTVHSGHSHRYSVTIHPARAGQIATFQYRSNGRGPWRTLARAKVARNGAAAFVERLRPTGRYQLRVVSPASSQAIATVSPPWSLRVIR